jgi:hypothetical protein
VQLADRPARRNGAVHQGECLQRCFWKGERLRFHFSWSLFAQLVCRPRGQATKEVMGASKQETSERLS